MYILLYFCYFLLIFFPFCQSYAFSSWAVSFIAKPSLCSWMLHLSLWKYWEGTKGTTTLQNNLRSKTEQKWIQLLELLVCFKFLFRYSCSMSIPVFPVLGHLYRTRDQIWFHMHLRSTCAMFIRLASTCYVGPTRWAILSYDINIYVTQRKICVTQSNDRQVIPNESLTATPSSSTRK